MGKIVRLKPRSVKLDRDFKIRGSRCILITNEAASLRADVQRLSRQLRSARSTVAHLHGSLPSLIGSVSEAVAKEFE